MTQAMQLIDSLRAEDMTVHVSIDGGGGLWSAPEQWPVPLNLGVTLSAPNVHFLAPADYNFGVLNGVCEAELATAFRVQQFDSQDQATVTLEGEPSGDGGYLYIGIPTGVSPADHDFSVALDDSSVLPIEDGDADAGVDGLYPLPLIVRQAWLSATCEDIAVGAGGSLTLGPGPVHLGSWDGRRAVNASQGGGLSCIGEPSRPAQVWDVGEGALQIDSVRIGVALAYCDATLVNAPSIGRNPDGGINSCPGQPLTDDVGIEVGQSAHLVFGEDSERALVQCQQLAGILVDRGQGAAAPVVAVSGDIRNVGCYGLEAFAGSVDLRGSTVEYCDTGIWVGGNVRLRLGGDPGSDGQSIVGCISLRERENAPGVQCMDPDIDGVYGPMGAALVNSGSLTVDAEGVLWPQWDRESRAPPIWECPDGGYTECRCVSGSCIDAGGISLYEMDTVAVFVEGNLTPFFFDGGGQAPMSCK